MSEHEPHETPESLLTERRRLYDLSGQDEGELPIKDAFLWSLAGHAILAALLFFTTMAVGFLTVKTIVDKIEEKKLAEAKRKVIEIQFETAEPDQEKKEQNFQFVEVDPNLASEEPPEEKSAQSMVSTKAANLAPKLDIELPNIEGSQKDVVRTVNEPKPVAMPPAQPVRPEEKLIPDAPEELPQAPKTAQPKEPLVKEEPPRQMAKVEEKPMPLRPLPEKKDDPTPPKEEPGNTPAPRPQPNMSLPRPTPKTEEDPPEKPNIPEREKPHRSLMQAQIENNVSPGEAMDQEGGSRTIGVDSVDTLGTAAGIYFDRAIKAMKKRWFDLIDERAVGTSRVGHVLVTFRFYPDGRVDGVRIAETTVNDSIMEYICIAAISDPQPYGLWPQEMRNEIGSSYKSVSFRFTYR